MPVDAEKYVVLDVETNGLASLKDDLLSISLYQPDTKKIYNRFLPLELSDVIRTTAINGIKKEDLEGATPLTQKEVDSLILEYDLLNRTILTYGNFDERFIKNYFKRKMLKGFENLHFFNMKRNIISSSFSEGNITKDNLCRIYGIPNVKDLHSGINDCLLEWELFKRIGENKLLVDQDNVYELSEDYIIPASYLSYYTNLKYHIKNLPQIKCTSREVKRFDIENEGVKDISPKLRGEIFENLINSMLGVERIDSFEFLCENKKKLRHIGVLPSGFREIDVHLNSNGTVYAKKEQDEPIVREVNRSIFSLKDALIPLVEYIKTTIFSNQKVFSQELVIHEDKNVFALCDLSSQYTVLEIKSFNVLNLDKIGNQLFYGSNGRDCYILQIEKLLGEGKLSFIISRIEFEIGNAEEKSSIERRIENFQKKISNKKVEVVEYIDSTSRVTLRCQICGKTYSRYYSTMIRNSECPYCNPSKSSIEKEKVNLEEKQKMRAQKYFDKIYEKSSGVIKVLEYNGSNKLVKAHCNVCGYEWYIRADHLMGRLYCPLCRKRNKQKTLARREAEIAIEQKTEIKVEATESLECFQKEKSEGQRVSVQKKSKSFLATLSLILQATAYFACVIGFSWGIYRGVLNSWAEPGFRFLFRFCLAAFPWWLVSIVVGTAIYGFRVLLKRIFSK